MSNDKLAINLAARAHPVVLAQMLKGIHSHKYRYGCVKWRETNREQAGGSELLGVPSHSKMVRPQSGLQLIVSRIISNILKSWMLDGYLLIWSGKDNPFQISKCLERVDEIFAEERC